ncbi:vacuolar protein sorting-associated protein 4A-like [Haliotis rufescens]|uniref:vacuolar protein sorting-associated protein 4A-like n=1 Tax=Haliotis rufescens TaxID=6454 RepID=UPI00201FA8F9|nr:vacuolar protein sorting-associated protein 4A-like [Haliotis rufescens]
MASGGCGNNVIDIDGFDLSEILKIADDVECRGGAVVDGGCRGSVETGNGPRSGEDLNSHIDGEVSGCGSIDEKEVSHDKQETQKDTIHKKMATAVDLLRRAVESEKSADNKESFRLYKDSIEILLEALKKTGKKGRLRTLLTTKIKALLTKAKHLKDQITEKREASVLSKVPQRSDEYDEATLRKRDYLAGFIEDPNEKLNRSNIVGQEEAVSRLMEHLVLPSMYPQLFQNRRMPGNILLYGHPGTGKTMALRAVASDIPDFTFFKLSIYDFMNKYEPDEARNVRELFMMASERKNCIICLEDVDRIHRDESDLRLRSIYTELMVQMEGYAKQVRVVFVTQRPWNLKRPFRRRLSSRIYFQLPTKGERINILKANLKETNHKLTEKDFDQIGDRTASLGGYRCTQADMVALSREIMMQVVRRVQCAKYFRKMAHPVTKIEDHWMPCHQDDEGAVEMTWMDVDAKKFLEPDIVMSDVLLSLANCSGTVEPGEDRQMSDWRDMVT